MNDTFPPIHSPLSDLMKGKKGIVMGVANDHSIAYGIAKSLYAHGASLAFTYQGEAFAKRVVPLAEGLGSNMHASLDASNIGDIKKVINDLGEKLGGIDFIVHAIAWSDKEELKGRYIDTSPDNFKNTLNISCYSFTAVAAAAEPYLNPHASLLTLTYDGANRVMPSYNVMGVAKAALESSVRYLAGDLGASKQARVNALSAGPMRTLAGSAIGGARFTYNWQGKNSPLARNITLDEVGNSGLYLLSPLSQGVTGEIHYIDSGYNIVGMIGNANIENNE